MALTESDFLERLVKLRILVAYLGEKEQCAWWSTRFLGAAGQRFLAFNYPRTAFAAGVTAASKAAKAFHDRRIGKGRVSHLFRLPHLMEQRLREFLLSPKATGLQSILASKHAAILALAELGSDATPAPEGPTCIGGSKSLFRGAPIPKLATLYSRAFQTEKQTLPYFTAEEG